MKEYLGYPIQHDPELNVQFITVPADKFEEVCKKVDEDKVQLYVFQELVL